MRDERYERAAARLLRWNSGLVRRVDGAAPNPRPLDAVEWNDRLVASAPTIREEWDHANDRGLRLPLLEQLVIEHQGNVGDWRAGLIFSRGRPRSPLADEFPETIRSLQVVPGLRSALFSVLEPGTELPEHHGPNAGVLRYHLGVSCPDECALRVGDVEVPYVDGGSVLFDDSEPHAAWNRSDRPRVTLFLEILRPLPPLDAVRNRVVQEFVSLDPRFRLAPVRASERHRILNHRR